MLLYAFKEYIKIDRTLRVPAPEYITSCNNETIEVKYDCMLAESEATSAPEFREKKED